MYSFDVFDTLITRTTALPNGIFALMQSKLDQDRTFNGLESYVIDNFFELRIHSEELARKSASFQQTEEVDLNRIYDAMALCGCITREQIEYLCQMEQDIEMENVEGISENIQRVKDLVRQGERVILISDMYLSGNTIHKMLVQVDSIFENMPLYVSSDYGKRKTTGNLYRVVQDIEHIRFEDWTHLGDNMYQDIQIPYHLGMNVEWIGKKGLTDFETRLLEQYGEDSRLQVMIGTAAMAEKGNKETAYHIGCRYAGPVLYSYAEWIVGQAIKKKIRRLYFIARDGYLVKKIVDIMISKRQIGIKTGYIYGSRKAWRMASLSDDSYNLYQLVLWSHINRITTLDELALVFHIPLDDLYRYLPGVYAKDKGNRDISNQELEYIVGKLAENVQFKAYHLQHLSEERMLAQQYLEQEIDFSDGNFAFVDISGGGLTQGCLQQLIKNRYPKPIRTFFFKIDRVNLAEHSLTDTFIPSFLENSLAVEMMCRAPHGQTEGYVLKDNKVRPKIEKSEGELLIQHGFNEYEKGIMDFSERICDISKRSGLEIASMKHVLQYLKYIAHEPSKEVLEYFASMPSNEAGRGKEMAEYAPRLTKQQIKDIFLTRMGEPIETFYKGTDLNYSIMRASSEESALMEQYKKEYDSPRGILSRLEKVQKQKELRKKWGRAAFYPTRLLEERIILYGAGKFGQDLHNRLAADEEHTIVLWVDKDADAYRKKGLTDVCCVSEIKNRLFDQVVIAVMDRKLADCICEELEAGGICREKMIWIQPTSAPGHMVQWKTEKIG